MNLKWSRPLWRHQEDAIKRFAEAPFAALFHDMGVGKTTTAIGLIRSKFKMHEGIFRTLIFSPLATLWNWKKEFEINSPESVYQNVAIAYGKEKLTAFDSKIVILNYEALDSKTMCEKIKRFGAKIVVCDEGHRIKNPKSKRFKKLIDISDQAVFRYLLTGTPVLNQYLDLWSQMRFLTAGRIRPWDNYFVFRSQYFVDKNAGMPKALYFPNWQPHDRTAKELTKIVSVHSSRVEKSECLDLPPLLKVTEYVELGAEQQKAYIELESQLITEVKNGECVASNALVKCLRLLQIISGHMPVEGIFEKYHHRFKENPRLERLIELLEDITPNHKVIVWCTFVQNYHDISDALKTLKIPYAELTGETIDRQKEIDRFQTETTCRVMVANPQAGGVGINLTAASYSIYYSRNYSLGDYLQSEARNYRGGSDIHEKITQIHLVAKNTIDETVCDALSKKEDFADNILERIKSLC